MPALELTETLQRITLRTPELEVAWSREDGSLQVLRHLNSANLVGHGVAPAGLDVALGAPANWLATRSFVRYLAHQFVQENSAVRVVIVVGLGPLKLYDRYEIVGTLISRRVTIENVSPDDLQVYGLRILVPNARITPVEHCAFEAPGNSVRPHVPLAVAASQRPGVLPRRFFAPGLRDGSALELTPTHGSGLLALHNTPPSGQEANGAAETLLCWYASNAEAALPFVEGDEAGPAISLGHDVRLAGWLQPGGTLISGIQHVVLLRQTWSHALATFQHTLPLRGIRPTDDQAAWLRDAAIFETHPGLYGGFRRMTELLPDLAAMGVTTLLLLPIWERARPHERPWDGNWIDSGSPYALRSFERLDATLGAPDDLRALVAAARQHGLRVLLDLVVQGCASDSPYVEEHPDWFVKDETGAFVTTPSAQRHSGCYSFDMSNPELQAHLHTWAITQMQRYNIDGYRIVTPYNPALNWTRRLPYPASAGSMGLLPLLRRLRHDLRRLKPDAALLCDLSGPAYIQMHDACYDYPVHHMFVHTALNRMTPAELGAYLRDHATELPPESVRICFMETHDTCDANPLVGGLRGSRISRMLLAGMVFCGFVPSLWAGQEQGEEMVIRELLRLRREHPVLRYGRTLYNVVHCDAPEVFVVVRLLNGRAVLGLLNVGPHKRTVTLGLPVDLLGLTNGRYRLRELMLDIIWSEEGRRSWQRDELRQTRLTLEPFGAYCVAVEVDPSYAPETPTTIATQFVGEEQMA